MISYNTNIWDGIYKTLNDCEVLKSEWVCERMYQWFIVMYFSGGQICNWSRFNPGFKVLKYHVADKHDTPPSHFKLTLGQLALLYALNGEC